MILGPANHQSTSAQRAGERARQARESSQAEEETLYFERCQEGIHGPKSARPLSPQERAIQAQENHLAEQDELLFEAQQKAIQESMKRRVQGLAARDKKALG